MLDYDLRHGRTYLYFEGQPLYALVHGLSYTRFVSRTCAEAATTSPQPAQIEVSVDVTNRGDRAGRRSCNCMYAVLTLRSPARNCADSSVLCFNLGETKTVTLALDGARLRTGKRRNIVS